MSQLWIARRCECERLFVFLCGAAISCRFVQRATRPSPTECWGRLQSAVEAVIENEWRAGAVGRRRLEMLEMLYNMQKSSGLTFTSFVICFLTIQSRPMHGWTDGGCVDLAVRELSSWPEGCWFKSLDQHQVWFWKSGRSGTLSKGPKALTARRPLAGGSRQLLMCLGRVQRTNFPDQYSYFK